MTNVIDILSREIILDGKTLASDLDNSKLDKLIENVSSLYNELKWLDDDYLKYKSLAALTGCILKKDEATLERNIAKCLSNNAEVRQYIDEINKLYEQPEMAEALREIHGLILGQILAFATLNSMSDAVKKSKDQQESAEKLCKDATNFCKKCSLK
jgi:hypothetical protein